MKKYKFETLQVHAGQEAPDKTTGSRAVPIYATTSYVFDDCADAAARFALEKGGNIYSRIGNPTTDIFEARMAALEGGKGALATASGTAAISYAIQNIATVGSHIVSSINLYGGTYNLFKNTFADMGIGVTFVDGDIKEYEKAIKNNTKGIFIESLGNPNSDILDIEGLANLAHSYGVPLIVDNTFATPYLLRPIEYGADIVVHSATKFIGGHGTVIGGVIVDGGHFDWAQNDKFEGLSKPNANFHGVIFAQLAGDKAYIAKLRSTILRDLGACISPFNSFLLLQGLETLSLRVERHVKNALQVVDFLATHPEVEKVNHPKLAEHPDHRYYQKYFPQGGGSIFTVEVKGGIERGRRFCEKLKLFSLLANVADVKSLVIHPASTTHSQLDQDALLSSGIKPSTIRLSIGTEHIDDIIADLQQAFEASK